MHLKVYPSLSPIVFLNFGEIVVCFFESKCSFILLVVLSVANYLVQDLAISNYPTIKGPFVSTFVLKNSSTNIAASSMVTLGNDHYLKVDYNNSLQCKKILVIIGFEFLTSTLTISQYHYILSKL